LDRTQVIPTYKGPLSLTVHRHGQYIRYFLMEIMLKKVIKGVIRSCKSW